MFTLVKDIKNGQEGFNLQVAVIDSIEQKYMKVFERPAMKVKIGDSTGCIDFFLWDDGSCHIAAGDSLILKNCMAKVKFGRLTVYLMRDVGVVTKLKNTEVVCVTSPDYSGKNRFRENQDI